MTRGFWFLKPEFYSTKSPLKIKVGNKREIELSGYRYTIKTMELKNGDSIVIKDRDGNVFVDVKVVI